MSQPEKRKLYGELHALSEDLSDALEEHRKKAKLRPNSLRQIVDEATGVESKPRRWGLGLANRGTYVFFDAEYCIIETMGPTRDPSLVMLRNSSDRWPDWRAAHLKVLEATLHAVDFPQDHRIIADLQRNFPEFSYDVSKRDEVLKKKH